MVRLGQRLRYLRMLTLGALVVTSLIACGDRQTPLQFRGTDITGSSIGGDFSMSDHTGQTRKLSDFRNKVVLLFFGYTHCPDVCPTTLSEVAAALKELGPKADAVQVVFVTVDPDRDTQALLAQYVPAFNPRFMALRGSREELETAAKLFKVVYEKNASPSGNYTMNHTAGTFVLDQKGRLRLLIPYGAGVDVLVHDLSQLLR